jgi:trans-aconitate methyltransferase
MADRSWKDIWEGRRLGLNRASVLSRLMAADGLDTGFGNIDEPAWRSWVERVGRKLEVTSSSSVFEVGCGAGAFVYPWYQAGATIGGLDASETLLGFAKEVMPRAQLMHAEAAELDASNAWDVVVSMGVFLYFPSLDYARGVLERMVKKARRRVAVLDVADSARRHEALAMRRGFLDEAEYEKKYRGLDHLYLSRDWLAATLEALGLTDVEIADQDIPGYANAQFRFNAFARCRL